uniref:15-oxoprostaglandin 13-reductase n=1 Tax=Hirondellea gigas TaxID=1518452 RepID=A0A6A7FWX0_9CRUS
MWDWETYSKVKIVKSDPYQPVTKVPDGISFPTWLTLGANQGATSYFGILECAQLKGSDNVVISAAAGATGSLAGQIAKLKGCHVVGFCGTDDKCRLLKSLGFDGAINYRTCGDLSTALRKQCPNGVDVYFDNVGGRFLEAVLNNINQNGRVAVCGQLGSYNSKVPVPGPSNISALIFTQARIQGFNVLGYSHRWKQYLNDITPWILSNKLQAPKPTIIEGIENSPEALTRLFNGKKTGKMLVHVADPDPTLSKSKL